jgi:hypothetical protein
MKLRLISRLIVVTLVVIVGLIIVIHQLVTNNGSHPAQTTPTASPHSSISGFHATALLRDSHFGLFEQAAPVLTIYTA